MTPQHESRPDEVTPEEPKAEAVSTQEVKTQDASLDAHKPDQNGVIVEHDVNDPNYQEYVAPSAPVDGSPDAASGD